MIRLLLRLPLRLLRRVRFTWHLTTDPACVHYRVPRAGSALDATSRGYPCPECSNHPLRLAWFTCPRCDRTSYNPNDIREGYCGACHDWTGPRPTVS